MGISANDQYVYFFERLIMLYLDYHWDLSKDGILLDEEMTAEKLNRNQEFELGDIFVLEMSPAGRLILKKKTGVERLLLGAGMDLANKNITKECN